MIATGQNSSVCLEESCIFPVTDSYLHLPSIYNHCLEGIVNMVLRKCQYCKNDFEAKIGEINRGRAKYCSKNCWYKARVGTKLSEKTKQKIGLGGKGRIKSKEEKEKISISRMGWNPSIKTRNRMSIAKKGKRLPETTRKRMSEAHKGLLHTEEEKEKISNGRKGKRHAEELKQRLSEERKGEKNPNWNGGTSFEPYCSRFNEQLKEQIRERDGRTCQLCNVREGSKKLHVHHIHYDKPNCDPDLISLCNRCNSKVNFNREYYEGLFMNKLKNKGILNEPTLNIQLKRG